MVHFVICTHSIQMKVIPETRCAY